VFAYGNREEILNNPDVRRHYIGERFDVGHLLDRRRPASLPHVPIAENGGQPPADSGESAATAELTSHLVTTEIYSSSFENIAMQSIPTDPRFADDSQIETASPSPLDDDWD
jgi:lipopolysaccharide export system ATP-binding protein